MSAMADYRGFRAGMWKITVLPGQWNQELQERVLAIVEREAAAKHPRVFALAPDAAAANRPLYLKVFHPPPGIALFKDLFRQSKASRFLRQGLALSEAGFHVPVVVAVGELRRWRLLKRAFVLTLDVGGQSLTSFLEDCRSGRKARIGWREKKAALGRFAELIRKFHDRGFVHGDLVPTNIFVSGRPGEPLDFVFMDNDRTRRYPRWLPHSLWKRNLVQLNRFPLPGISLHDRVRFFRFYSGQRGRVADERLLRWLEARTRRRRKECDGIDATIAFRKLMRWNASSRKMIS